MTSDKLISVESKSPKVSVFKFHILNTIWLQVLNSYICRGGPKNVEGGWKCERTALDDKMGAGLAEAGILP